MNEDLFTESAADLRAQAKQAGHDISPEQLARWHRAGLLPSPKQRGLGQKRGSEAVYPKGTARQLLALCALRRKDRRLAQNGWALWWQGFPVSGSYAQDVLRDVAMWWDGTVERIRKVASQDHGWDVILDWIDENYGQRLPKSPGGAVRKRVGVERFPTLLRIILEMIEGGFSGLSKIRPDEKEPSDEVIFEKAMGISRARKDRINNGEPWLTSDISPILAQVTSSAFGRPLTEILEETPWETVEAARNDLFSLFRILGKVSLFLEQSLGKHAFGLGVIGDMARNLDSRQQATFLLLWLALRLDQGMKDGMQALLKAILGEQSTAPVSQAVGDIQP